MCTLYHIWKKKARKKNARRAGQGIRQTRAEHPPFLSFPRLTNFRAPPRTQQKTRKKQGRASRGACPFTLAFFRSFFATFPFGRDSPFFSPNASQSQDATVDNQPPFVNVRGEFKIPTCSRLRVTRRKPFFAQRQRRKNGDHCRDRRWCRVPKNQQPKPPLATRQ